VICEPTLAKWWGTGRRSPRFDDPFKSFVHISLARQTRLLAPMADFDDGVVHARFNSHHAHIARQL
jgi:hypothetical protein